MSATATRPRRHRVHRSELAVPATSEKFFAKAAASGADAVFLDLEDAVSSEKKEIGRKNAIAALNEVDWGRKTMAVRVNGLDTPWGLRDIVDVVTACPRLDLVLLPKAGTAFDIKFVETVVAAIEREQRREKRIGIEALIESAQGLANVEEIAAASERLEALIFGIADYSISLQTFDIVIGEPNPKYAIPTKAGASGKQDWHWNDQWHYALARIANACRAYGARPIDGPYTNYGDPDGCRASAERAAALGFEGKWAIHPSQVTIVNEVFTPTSHQIDWARKLLGALQGAFADGRGAVGVDGMLVDIAHEKLARAILARAGLEDSTHDVEIMRFWT